MNAPDSVEKAGYLQHDVVRRLKPSEPGRQELFRKTLEEELEDELDQKRKKRTQDEVVLEHREETDDEAGRHAEAEQTAATPDPDGASSGDEPGESDTADSTPTGPPHVDVKA